MIVKSNSIDSCHILEDKVVENYIYWKSKIAKLVKKLNDLGVFKPTALGHFCDESELNT